MKLRDRLFCLRLVNCGKSIDQVSIWHLRLRLILSFVLLFLSLTRVKEFLFSFQVQVFASLILHFRTSVTRHLCLMGHRGSFWWIQLHFLASLALHKVQQAPLWVGRWHRPSRDTSWILPSFTQLFGLTYLFIWMLKLKIKLYNYLINQTICIDDSIVSKIFPWRKFHL